MQFEYRRIRLQAMSADRRVPTVVCVCVCVLDSDEPAVGAAILRTVVFCLSVRLFLVRSVP